MLHIKLKRITNAATWKQIFSLQAALPPPPLPQFGMRSIGLYSFILAHGQAAYQIKGNHEMQQHGSKHFAHRRLTNPSPLTPGWSQ